MNSAAIDICALLVSAGLSGGSTGWQAQASRERDTPAQQVTIYDTGGYSPYGYGAEQPTIQIRVRGNADSYAIAYAKIKAIRDYLLAQNNITIAGTVYSSFEAIGDIQSLGYDDKSRPIFVCNFKTLRI